MPLDEFDLIQRYFTRPVGNTVLGVGDDAALIAPTPGMQLAVSADTLVEGRHFFAGCDAEALGWKCLAVNLSDMAAMGARPRWFTLCLSLPQADPGWLAAFSRGMFALADEHDVALIGGDTTAGPLTISIQIMGEVAPGLALRRDAGQVGDDIWLSGCTGAAAMAVAQRYGKLQLGASDLAYCAARLDKPQPRVALGLALSGLAHAAIDVSDGLLADLGHIAARSQLAAELRLMSLPLPPLSDEAMALPALDRCLLAGGDDYELCFTAAPAVRPQIEQLATALALRLSHIGQLKAGQGVTVLDANDQPVRLPYTGFNHFA